MHAEINGRSEATSLNGGRELKFRGKPLNDWSECMFNPNQNLVHITPGKPHVLLSDVMKPGDIVVPPDAVDTQMFMAPYDMNSHARDKLLSNNADTKPNTPDSDDSDGSFVWTKEYDRKLEQAIRHFPIGTDFRDAKIANKVGGGCSTQDCKARARLLHYRWSGVAPVQQSSVPSGAYRPKGKEKMKDTSRDSPELGMARSVDGPVP